MPTAPPRCCGGNVFPHPMFPFTRTPSLPRRPMRRVFLSEFALAFPLPLPYELWVHYFRFFGLPRLPASGSRLSVKSFGDVGWWGVARARGVETSTSTRILLPKRSRAPVASGLWPPADPFVPLVRHRLPLCRRRAWVLLYPCTSCIPLEASPEFLLEAPDFFTSTLLCPAFG